MFRDWEGDLFGWLLLGQVERSSFDGTWGVVGESSLGGKNNETTLLTPQSRTRQRRRRRSGPPRIS